MKKAVLILLSAAAVLLVQVSTIEVFNCVTRKYDNNLVDIAGCTTLPCPVIAQKPDQDFNLKFTPTSTINNLTVRASTKIQGGKWKPFVPFDGLSACNFIYTADNNKPVSCPLESHVDYIFEKHGLMGMNITNFNASIGHYSIHWALENNGSNVACFEIDAIVVYYQ